MNRLAGFTLATALLCGIGCGSDPIPAIPPQAPPPASSIDAALDLRSAAVTYRADLDAVIFSVQVAGDAGSVVPSPAGSVDGAPVLGYVFPTDLAPEAVGFSGAEGTVALAVTSHPDFDDTPLWDEDDNARYDDDGAVYHAHWVLLQPDDRAAAGLAVVQSPDMEGLPPTAPMPMYLDSPGFTVVEDGSELRVVVPADRIDRRLDLTAGALVADMKVDASGEAPLLKVEAVVSQLSDGALAFSVEGRAQAPASAWPALETPDDIDEAASFDIENANITYDADTDAFIATIDVVGDAATIAPRAAGQVDGAPVLGYVFPTTIAPAELGFVAPDGGILALAVTSHPDFDDTPLWDENRDRDYGNDGAVYHVHWAVLVSDEASPAGLSVPSQPEASALPPTAPMPMYLDSPGYHAFATGHRLSVVVPAWPLSSVESFSFDAVTAAMRVDASGDGPVLRVEQVFDVLSGDLSLPLAASR